MPVNPGTFMRATDSKLFLPGIRKVLIDLFQQVPWVYKQFFFETTSKMQTEKDYSVFGIESIPEKDEGDNYQYGSVIRDTRILYSHYLWILPPAHP
jgi:hypothetical protein